MLKPIFFGIMVFTTTNVYAQSEIPFNGPINSIEYKASGNTFTWHPVTGETPRPAQPYRPDFSGGTVSNVEPRAKWSPQLPYEHKGGPNAKLVFSAVASKAMVAGAAAKEFAKGAIACGAKPGHPLAVSAAIAGCMGGTMLLGAAIDWGWSQLSVDSSGDVSIGVPADLPTFTGNLYYTNVSDVRHVSIEDACIYSAPLMGYTFRNVDGNRCRATNSTTYAIWSQSRDVPQGCSVGMFYKDGVCYSPENVPKVDVPLEQVVTQKIVDDPWGIASAKAMAGVMMAGHNVFTDGTSGTISGPNSVPLGTDVESWPVNVIAGTATEAPAGYAGQTEPGTKSTNTSRQVTNTYSGNQQTAKTVANTVTTVTNNITNITNITNQSTSEKDEAPEEAPTDTPFADLPELYKQKYPDGLIGVLRTQTAAIKATPLFQLPTQLMGDLPQTGQCPSWQIDLSLSSWASFGTYNVGADCAIWDFAGWVIVISAFLLARQLIFGG